MARPSTRSTASPTRSTRASPWRSWARAAPAARSIGVAPLEIVFRHLLPNVISSVTVAATFGMANAILQEASLSFLGLGVQAPTPSWGNMLRDAQTFSILEKLPWLWLAPGIMIALAVLSINFIGDGLRDALDPRSTL